MPSRKRNTNMDLLGWLPDTALHLFMRIGTMLLALNLLAVGLCLWTASDTTIATFSAVIALGISLGARAVIKRREKNKE